MSTALANISRAVQMLAEARTLDDITHVRSIAKAAEEYARAEHLGDEAEQHAREIRVRAGRKAGELLAEMKRQGERDPGKGGDRKSQSSPTSVMPTLSDLGITSDESSRWQNLARVPEKDFEEQVQSGWGETAIARGGRGASRRSDKARRAARNLPPKAKTNGYTLKQSLTGLQDAAIQVQGLAEGLDGGLLGDWARLYDLPEAQQWFDVIEESLPVLNARLKRSLRERGKHGNAAVG